MHRFLISFLIFTIFCFYLFPIAYVQADEFLPTAVEIIVACGDGLTEGVEVCDPGNPPAVAKDIGTTTCADFDDIFGNQFESGDLDCLSDCTNFSTSTCYTCGNGYKENSEECDNTDFGGSSCISLGYSSGSLVCTANCHISTVNCESQSGQGGTPGAGPSGGAAGGTSGYKPGSQNEEITKVVVKGKSYPHADVHILVDGKVIGIVNADAKADFYFETTNINSGVVSFGFWSEDTDGLKSTLLSLTFRVISGAVTTITGVYIAPTININKQSVRQGEDITVFGQTVPATQVHIHIHSAEDIVKQTDSKKDGNWQLVYNTKDLKEDFHTAKALFQLESGENIIKSGFSKSVSFYVGKVGNEAVCPEADLNHDSRVNLTDFSILLYYWGTDNACADQNQNGTVDLVDFSIMMYYWTG